MPNGQFPEVIQLADLNGQNGFKIDGENSNDNCGSSVSSAGDINGDGYEDLLIGAKNYPMGTQTGCSYVVFGGPNVGHKGTIALSSLTRTDGFKLNGEESGDFSGSSVSTIGDINGDMLSDIVIGAWGHPPYPAPNYGAGRSYVLFGGSDVGQEGTVALADLTSADGFKIDGENRNDNSGASVSAAGDVNGDGYADLLIGAPVYQSGNMQGRTYVVFGRPAIGSNGTLSLSSLTGANGFKIDGESSPDLSGNSVSSAGDINNDGYADLLIGAAILLREYRL